MALSGHLWTLVPTLLHRVWHRPVPESVDWSTTLEDPEAGRITLRGRYRALPGADTCVLVVHGLGGTTDTFYCERAARAVEAVGRSCLRLSLRGADRMGEDFYHAGLTADLDAAIASPELAGYRHIQVLGYSLGGHVTLRYALGPADGRVRAVAAICPPLDLARGALGIDHPRGILYRRHVLAGLNQIYEAVAARGPVPTPVAQVRGARTIREWDGMTVVPRYGFDSVDDYYTKMSAGPALGRIELPALIIQSEHDPMVPPWTYRDHLEREHPRVTAVQLHVGGHVSFPSRVHFPDGAASSVDRYALDWLSAR